MTCSSIIKIKAEETIHQTCLCLVETMGGEVIRTTTLLLHKETNRMITIDLRQVIITMTTIEVEMEDNTIRMI
jgi:hypothetical protein